MVGLVQDYLAGKLALERFCEEYEYLWNFERPDGLAGPEVTLFEQLFDTVSWYSPFAKERQDNPAFKDEGQIVEKILSIREGLGEAWKKRRDPG